MAHKTLVGGTAYNITGGKSMVSGTTYSVKKGRTLVGGTGYDISFDQGATALLYNTGDLAFQRSTDVEEGKTLKNSYTGFEETSYSAKNVPWNSKRYAIKNIYCNDEIQPYSMAHWFTNCRNLVTFNSTNFNINNVINMYNTFLNCVNLIGTPVCGDKVISMVNAYYNCSNLTGQPVCGNNVSTMVNAYYNCKNLIGAPVCGKNTKNMAYAYRACSNLTGPLIIGENVTNMYYAYTGCVNRGTNAYIYSTKVTNMYYCFYNANNSRILRIYVPQSSATLNTIIDNSKKPIGPYAMDWVNHGIYYYSSNHNLYVYPVENVAATAIANGDEEANANAGITNNSITSGDYND